MVKVLAFAALIAAAVPCAAQAQTLCNPNPVPAAAATAGYTLNTFSSNGFTTANVDMSKTYAAGFQWYPFNFYSTTPTTANVVLNGDGSMTVGVGGASFNTGNLLSVGAKTGGPGYTGTAFGGGAYIEASLKFTAASLPTNAEWPAFWTNSLEGILQTTQWSGQAAGYSHFAEVDIMEYFEGEFGNSLTSYQGNLHDWYGPNTSLSNYDLPLTATETQASFSAYHKYGMLWVPATASSSGKITFYYDGTAIGSQTYTQFTTQSPPPSASTPWAFGVVDQQHLVLEIDSNNTYPITMQSVNVWQATNANNVSN